MRRAGGVVLAAAVVATAVLGALLLVREKGGPPHHDVTLPGDVPATFYPRRTTVPRQSSSVTATRVTAPR